MKCDELKRFEIVGKYTDDETIGECYDADEVDAAIAELKEKIDVEKSIGDTFSKNGAELARWVEELRNEIESLKASHYAESVDAGMRERRLKRALWLARAERAKAMKAIVNLDNYLSLHKNSKWFRIYATRIDTWFYKWDNVERKCLKKAEEYE